MGSGGSTVNNDKEVKEPKEPKEAQEEKQPEEKIEFKQEEPIITTSNTEIALIIREVAISIAEDQSMPNILYNFARVQSTVGFALIGNCFIKVTIYNICL